MNIKNTFLALALAGIAAITVSSSLAETIELTIDSANSPYTLVAEMLKLPPTQQALVVGSGAGNFSGSITIDLDSNSGQFKVLSANISIGDKLTLPIDLGSPLLNGKIDIRSFSLNLASTNLPAVDFSAKAVKANSTSGLSSYSLGLLGQGQDSLVGVSATNFADITPDKNGTLDQHGISVPINLLFPFGAAAESSTMRISGKIEATVGTKRILGDVNKDGIFNETDFILVFQAGKYETNDFATFEEGDWNGDGKFDTSDLIAAFSSGCYQKSNCL